MGLSGKANAEAAMGMSFMISAILPYLEVQVEIPKTSKAKSCRRLKLSGAAE
jgi:hypothetical protein